ncbi:MAG TPA: SRPBCC domain-containing protein, partial [Streptosporangiaceae bacterium]|nr:SRPBCC domain-containing protein [Streptosporangiaceae bacterium]
MRKKLFAALAAVAAMLAGYGVYTNVSPYTLQSSIQIQATPQQVWAVLADTADYPSWNPFITSSSGDVRVGATLTNVMHDATGNTTFTPTVEVVSPDRELRWIGRVG